MKIAVVGGIGAMGGLFGGRLASAGMDVTLVDVWHEAVESVNADGLLMTEKPGEQKTIPVRATTDPAEVGLVDLIIIFVKCYHTEDAIRNAASLLRPDTS